MKRWLGYTLFVFALVSLMGCAAAAQKADSSMQCREGDRSWNDGKLQNHCEIREQTLAAGGAVNVDAGRNGGVSIKGWDRNEVLVRSKIQTAAPSEAEAVQLAKEVRIETSGQKIRAEGPDGRDNFNWSVSFEIFVPRRSDLALEAHNGGISISDVSGKMDFKTLNGGVSLRRVGGNVRGTTTNGGVHIELSGPRWDGETLDVRTTNGGVNLVMPNNYSAHLETHTVNGNVTSDFPLNVALTERGRMPKDIAVDIGSGGPTVRAVTTNGGVRVKRASE
jgi:Putative adhesin